MDSLKKSLPAHSATAIALALLALTACDRTDPNLSAPPESGTSSLAASTPEIALNGAPPEVAPAPLESPTLPMGMPSVSTDPSLNPMGDASGPAGSSTSSSSSSSSSSTGGGRSGGDELSSSQGVADHASIMREQYGLHLARAARPDKSTLH